MRQSRPREIRCVSYHHSGLEQTWDGMDNSLQPLSDGDQIEIRSRTLKEMKEIKMWSPFAFTHIPGAVIHHRLNYSVPLHLSRNSFTLSCQVPWKLCFLLHVSPQPLISFPELLWTKPKARSSPSASSTRDLGTRLPNPIPTPLSSYSKSQNIRHRELIASFMVLLLLFWEFWFLRAN